MTKRFNVTWTWDIEETPNLKYEGKTLEELEELRRVYFDRWNWETGDPKDREEFEAIDKEIELRKNTMLYGMDLEKELTEAISKEITEEIDKEILADILKMKE